MSLHVVDRLWKLILLWLQQRRLSSVLSRAGEQHFVQNGNTKVYTDTRLNWFWWNFSSVLFLAVICLTDSTRWLPVRHTPSTRPTRLTIRGTTSRMARRINAHPFSSPKTTSAPSRSSASSPATAGAATNRFTTQLMRRKPRRRRPPPAKPERCRFLKILSTSESFCYFWDCRHFRDRFSSVGPHFLLHTH